MMQPDLHPYGVTIQFKGGPKDGQLLVVTETPETLEYPYLSPRFTWITDPADAGYKIVPRFRHRYRRMADRLVGGAYLYVYEGNDEPPV